MTTDDDWSIQSKCWQVIFQTHGAWLNSLESGSVFSSTVCKMQASRYYVESLPER